MGTRKIAGHRAERESGVTFVRRVGLDTGGCPGNGYALCSDGNVWYYGQRLISNCGPLAAFLEAVAAGRWRCNLDRA
jgi:hypothetical protein